MRKHQFGSGTKIFINANLTKQKQQFTCNCRQLKRRNVKFVTCTKSDIEILNMAILHGLFPDFRDLRKEGNENPDISGDQNASVLSSC